MAWLLVQAADRLAAYFVIPGWVNSLLALVLILGFPVLVLFAWAYEITPQGLRREKDVDRAESITHLTGRKLDFVIIALLIMAASYFAAEHYVARVITAADRILTNGAVYTVDANRSWADAVAINDGLIVFVGSNEEVLTYAGADTEVHDLGGAMVLPGFHDMHTHLLIGMPTEEECDLLRLESIDAIRDELARCAQYEGLGD